MCTEVGARRSARAVRFAVKVGLLCAVPVCAGEMDALSIYVTLPPHC